MFMPSSKKRDGEAEKGDRKRRENPINRDRWRGPQDSVDRWQTAPYALKIGNARKKPSVQNGHPTVKPSVAYRTTSGVCFRGHAEEVLQSPLANSFRGKVDLIFTSP